MSQALPPTKPPELRKTTIVKLNMTKVRQLIRKGRDTPQSGSNPPPTTVSAPPAE